MRSYFRLLLRLVPLSALCLCALAFFGPATLPCAATTYYVAPTGNDTNPGTLVAPFLTIQYGINTAVSGDTVTVEDGTYTGPGDVDLDFGGRNITVTSQNGATKTIIDCGGAASSDGSGNHRGFNIAYSQGNIVINGLTVKNGYEYGGIGGGIYLNGGNVTVQNCIIKNNSSSNGGGLYNGDYSNNVSIINCIFTGNVATGYGGGIYKATYGTLAITNCTFTTNSAGTAATAPPGSGLYNYGGSLTLTNDILYGDTGGGGEIVGADVTATYCDIQGSYTGTGNINADPLFVNSPTDLHLQLGSPCLVAGTASGAPATDITGALRANPPSIGAYEAAAATGTAPTTTTLTSSLNPTTFGQSATFTVNVVGSGGTLTGTVTFSVDGTPQSSVRLSNGYYAAYSTSSLTGGSHVITAAYSGDAVFAPSKSSPLTQIVNPSSTTATLTSSLNPSVSGQNVIFTANVSSGGGSPTGTVTFTIDGTALPPVSLSYTGGLFSTASYSTLSLSVGTHIVTATYNGASNFSVSTSPPLTQTVYPHISPLYVSPSGSDSNPGTQVAPKLTIQTAINTTFDGDTVIVEDGTYTGPGDVDLDFGGRNIMVTSQNGPASTSIDCQGSSNNQHRGFLIQGGETNAVISGLAIKNGYTANNGGGIFIVYTSTGKFSVTNCIITNNTADDGGGIFNFNTGTGTINITNCTFANNNANGGGGGVYIDNFGSSTGTISVANCTITNNIAYNIYGGGGGILTINRSENPMSITNCTITDNTSYSTLNNNSGGIYNDPYNSSSPINLTNDIFYGDIGGEIGGPNISALYCDIQGGYTGTGNINADPLFVNSPTDLHLQPGSPCLGAGTATGAPTTTLDGYTRPNPPSIGAYEAAPISLPAAPTSLQAVAGNTTVTLTWTAPTGPITSYILYRGTSASSLTSLKAGITATTFTNVSLKNGTTYYYAVAAVNSTGTGAKSSIVSATPMGVPAAPTNFQAAAGNTQVTLTWTAPAGTVTSYTLYRGASPTSLTALKTGITAATFTNISLKNGTTYYYAVAAVNSAGTGAKSSTVSSIPLAPPAAPTNLQAVVGNLQATLTWMAPAGTVTSYTLYRGTSATSLTALKTGITATTFTNVSLKNGTTYYYTVSAVNAAGTGPASNEVSATP